MATSDELREDPHAEWELGFAIEGIEELFVSHPDLEVVDTGDGRVPRSGLVRQGLSRKMGVDLRTGHFVGASRTIKIEDRIGDLAQLFATDHTSVEPLETNILPNDDLTALTDFHDKWIGHEKIGPAGERRQYPVPFGDTNGLHHQTINEDADDAMEPISAPPVSDVPILWKGRRCALYRIFRDHIGNAAMDEALRFRPDMDTLVDGPSGLTGTADGSAYRGGPWRARDFDGDTNRVDFGIAAGSMPDLVGQPFAISFWVYRRSEASDDRAVNMDLDAAGAAALFVDLRTNGAVRLLWGTTGTAMERQTLAGVVPLDTWTQITVSGDGTLTAANYEIYIDGEAGSYATTTNGTGTARATQYRWSIGGRFSADTNCVDGRIANVSVWLRDLSHAEALEHYHTSYGWRPIAEWDRIWWGTLEDAGEVTARVWSLKCAGVESWLRKPLGSLYQTRETPIEFEVDYISRADNEEAHEAGIYISIHTDNEGANGGAGGTLQGHYGSVAWSTSFEFTEDTVFDLWNELGLAVGNAFTTAGTNGAWSSLAGCMLDLEGGASKRLVFAKGEDVAQRARCYIGMHKKLWGILGWDIGTPNSDGIYSREGFSSWESAAGLTESPGDGYVVFRFELGLEQGVLNDESGQERPAEMQTLDPDYKSGVVTLDPDSVKDGLVMLVDRWAGSTVAHFGQLRTSVFSDPTDPTAPYPLGGPDIDKSGLWVLSGKRRFSDEEEEQDFYQVVEGSWGDEGGMVRAGRVVVHGLLDPRDFGFDAKRLKGAWNSQPGAIVARPLVCIGYKQGSKLDDAHIVMQRLLLTTGTSEGWSSYSLDPDNVLDPGTNEPTHTGNVVRDAEYADLGLAIPESMVQIPSVWAAEAESTGNDALKCKVAITPGMNSVDVLHGLMEPLGWCWSLRNNKYGIFTPFASIDEDQIEVAITRADIDRGRSKEMIEVDQDLRQDPPIDKFMVRASWTPYEEAYLFEREVRSVDRGQRYRPGGVVEEIKAPWWRGVDGGGLSTPITERLQLKAKFWERRHYAIVRLPIVPVTGRKLLPGTFVRFSHDMAVDPVAGTYGVDGRRGVVYDVEERLDRDRGGFVVDFLIHADRTRTPKLHAFSARGYGYDSTNDRILVHDNWLALAGDGTRVDSAFFVEPTYVGLEPFEGDADIKWYQWDGAGWEQTGEGQVTAVGTTPGSCYLELGAGISAGTYYPCKDTIVVPAAFTDQTANWVLELYTGIGDEDGEISPGVLSATWEDVT